MEDPPHLTSTDVANELQRIYEQRRALGRESPRHLFAFFGRGVEERLRLDDAGEVEVVPVRSELELRAQLPPLGEHERRIAYLLPFTRDVPLDVAGRFHRDGKVVRIGPEARIRRLFGGVVHIEQAVSQSPLVAMLLASGTTETFPTSAMALDLEAMWSAWLARRVELPSSAGVIEREALIAWAARDARGPSFLADLPELQRAEVERALEAHLASRGPEFVAVFRAWRRGAGRDALELALVLEALARSELTHARIFVRESVRTVLGVDGEADAARVGGALGAAAVGALRRFEQSVSDSIVRATLRGADARATHPEIRELLADDPRLPVGWTKRLERLGAALRAGAAAPSVASVRTAFEALRALESHRMFRDPGTDASPVQRAEAAARLLGWLAERRDAQMSTGATTISDAEALGRWYAEEGGYVDWARHTARGRNDDVLGQGIAAVLAAADAARADLDARFVRSLRSYVQAQRASSSILPLDRVTERLGAKFLEENPDRRLLILLVDGMGWAQAVEILLSLEEQHVGPIAWNTSKRGRVGEGTAAIHNTVFAALPTVTEVSRSSFFEGAPIAPGAPVDAQRDDERFARNKAMRKFFDGVAVPKLLLRAELTDGSGNVANEARAAVRDPKDRVVAVVINAIDTSLKGDPQVGTKWTSETIKPLWPLLEAARDAGRSVLIVSDHGHVPSDLFQPSTRKPDAGARMRPWRGEADTLTEWEAVFQGAGVWHPKGSQGVVLVTDDRHRYSTGPHAGEHGGATLAEVVVPCLFLGFDESAPALDADPELRVRRFHQPDFWHFDIREPVTRKPIVAPPSQLPLLTEVPLVLVKPPPAVSKAAPPAPKADEPTLEPIALALRDSEILKAVLGKASARTQVVDVVSFLAARGGVASEEAFAKALAIQTRRVSQVVVTLQESLNLDSFPVLSHDRQGGEIRLDLELLIQQFQLERRGLK